MTRYNEQQIIACRKKSSRTADSWERHGIILLNQTAWALAAGAMGIESVHYLAKGKEWDEILSAETVQREVHDEKSHILNTASPSPNQEAMTTEAADIQIFTHGDARDRCPMWQRGQRLKSAPRIRASRSAMDSRIIVIRVPVNRLQSVRRFPLSREARRP